MLARSESANKRGCARSLTHAGSGAWEVVTSHTEKNHGLKKGRLVGDGPGQTGKTERRQRATPCATLFSPYDAKRVAKDVLHRLPRRITGGGKALPRGEAHYAWESRDAKKGSLSVFANRRGGGGRKDGLIERPQWGFKRRGTIDDRDMERGLRLKDATK